ncbi:MAG: GIY-YIG nuclease family protein [Patescibacteria group bacterium]|nr:GIY-YIG nuclease family protein [Patescibacteria group bacterium]
MPQDPGVYQFLDERGNVLYVGKAKQLKNRVSSYFANPQVLTGKTRVLVTQVKKIRIIKVESELEALLLEATLIKKFQPKYNIRLTDGKAYPLIRITQHTAFPAVLTARRPEDPNSMYFGPYPSSTSLRMVLRYLRRIFPYISDENHPKKICFYHHLGLCPCTPANATKEHIRTYKQTIKYIVDFLDGGKTAKVVKDLEKERDKASSAQAYEKAGTIQKQITAIMIITKPTHKPFEYETNPNLRSDVRQLELKSLQDTLKEHAVVTEFLHRIECYDNSNIQGTNPTSSMVVLTDGEIDKSQYRKFKIKTVRGPNDFASMQEVLFRRLNHPEWPLPQLFIVDGGKGQISSAMEVLTKRNIQIPLIGLAKREETIITSDFEEITLPKSSPALQLVMRIRDEAHRFAITFHRKLRQKATFL